MMTTTFFTFTQISFAFLLSLGLAPAGIWRCPPDIEQTRLYYLPFFNLLCRSRPTRQLDSLRIRQQDQTSCVRLF
jgi:hypothetical protein